MTNAFNLIITLIPTIMKNFRTIVLVFVILIIYSCKKEVDKSNEISKSLLHGSVQKGPFLNGTTITISELNSNLEQTGRVYNTQIDNSIGSFSINNVSLSSQYAILQANGFYFNEITGSNSEAQLTLSALTDLTDSSTININILTTLERKRVEYLISSGKSFEESKSQAREEVLKIFSINKPSMISPEYLDISKGGDDNAILLAVSSILQGYRTESELSELIANITEDIKSDGLIDNTSLGTMLISHAKVLEINKIRQNLQNKYESFNVDANIPDFEKYIKLFVDSTTFIYTDLVQYPDSGKSGYNLLSYSKVDYSGQTGGSLSSTLYKLSIAANIPKLATIKVKIKFNSYNPYTWSIDPTNSGWLVYNNWETEPGVFYFVRDDNSRENLDAKMNLIGTGTARIEVFENNLEIPIRVKDINW